MACLLSHSLIKGLRKTYAVQEVSALQYPASATVTLGGALEYERETAITGFWDDLLHKVTCLPFDEDDSRLRGLYCFTYLLRHELPSQLRPKMRLVAAMKAKVQAVSIPRSREELLPILGFLHEQLDEVVAGYTEAVLYSTDSALTEFPRVTELQYQRLRTDNFVAFLQNLISIGEAMSDTLYEQVNKDKLRNKLRYIGETTGYVYASQNPVYRFDTVSVFVNQVLAVNKTWTMRSLEAP